MAYLLQALGGSGLYNWASLDTGISTVTTKGVVTAVAEGTTTVRAYDEKTNLHYGESKVQSSS